MEENLQLQAEFEKLIVELQRLKSINDIANQNSKNAQLTIDEVETFVSTIKKFKETIENDYQKKKNNLDRFENTIDQTLLGLQVEIEKQRSKFDKKILEFEKESKKTIALSETDFTNRISNFEEKTEDFKENVNTNFIKFQDQISAKIQKEVSVIDLINTEHKDQLLEHLQNSGNYQEKQLEVYKQELNNKIASMEANINNSIHEKHEKQKNETLQGFSNLSEKQTINFKENRELLIDINEQSEKQNIVRTRENNTFFENKIDDLARKLNFKIDNSEKVQLKALRELKNQTSKNTETIKLAIQSNEKKLKTLTILTASGIGLVLSSLIYIIASI